MDKTFRSTTPTEKMSLRYLDSLYVFQGRELINHPNIAIRELMRTQRLPEEDCMKIYRLWLLNEGTSDKKYELIKTS